MEETVRMGQMTRRAAHAPEAGWGGDREAAREEGRRQCVPHRTQCSVKVNVQYVSST